MHKKIWIVEGHTGEYEDRRSWIVMAFDDEQVAKDFLKNCEKYALTEEQAHNMNYEEREKHVNPYDPHMSIDYTGTWYNMFDVPLYSQEDANAELEKLRKILA